MIQIVRRAGWYLITDPTRGTYKLASTKRADAQRTIMRATLAPASDWLNDETLARAMHASGIVNQTEGLDL